MGGNLRRLVDHLLPVNPVARRALAVLGICVAVAAPGAAFGSYAVAATDGSGSATGAAAVALGVPDYHFVNDAGLSYGGSNADVFSPGESTVLGFAAPLRNIPGQPDLLVSAFVGGAGATDTALVQVDVSSNGVNFSSAGSFNTASGRNPLSYPMPENGFESVKHFAVEFGAADSVTHVRLTNLSGSAEGLRLDAVEGLHPVTGSSHAFELRIEKYRDDLVGRFLLRIKNTADPGGVPIRELRIDLPPPPVHLEETLWSIHALYGQPGVFACAENCVFDNSPVVIPYGRHVWSLDGATAAPAGAGLGPGRQAGNLRNESFDTDNTLFTYLNGFSFTITFADGYEHVVDYTNDVLPQGLTGALFQKYLYFSSNPSVIGPNRVDTYHYVGPHRCSDGIDNDGDSLVDFPADPGCESAVSEKEDPACNDGIDNDGDGKIDLLDPHCNGIASKRSEWPTVCGLGVELVLVLPLLARLRRRSR
jgi:hypothetical protein